MSENIVTPHFLTIRVAEAAVDWVLDIIKGLHQCGRIKQPMCHIVVLVPSMGDEWVIDALGKGELIYHPTEPYLLYEHSFCKKSEWPHEFDRIARCKALQLWQERNDGRTDCMPHLLFQDDTPWWGGVKRDGIVVACSGLPPHFDRMIAGMVADMCIGMAYESWVEAKPQLHGDFLG